MLESSLKKCRGGLITIGVVHLEDKRTVFGVDLRTVEGGAIVSKAPAVALKPAAFVKGVEVVLPIEVKALRLGVVSLNLDVVISGVPRHSRVVEVVPPSWECWRPKVHH